MKHCKSVGCIVAAFFVAVLIMIAGCKNTERNKQHAAKIVIAKKQSVTTNLYFRTNIQPYRVVAVTSSAEGVITTRNFEYGQMVKKGRVLFIISSESSLESYYRAIVGYIKNKQEYLKSKINFSGTQDLWKHKLVSYEDYLSDRDALQAARLSYLQSRFRLAKFPGSRHFLQLSNISEKQFEELKTILAKKSQQIVHKSPMNGIALFSSKSGVESANQLRVGSRVKKGQFLVSIGDLEGITLSMKASEIHINHIKDGDKVTITGPAFPNEVLHGVITMVGSQSESSGFGSSASAEFPIKVLVKNLNDKQRALIHVGMTANVKLELSGKPEILIPINAIIKKNGNSYVRVQDVATRKTRLVSVITGKTTLDQVAVDSGLNENDRVVVP